MNGGQSPSPEPLDFFIWAVEDFGLWLEKINLGGYSQVFNENVACLKEEQGVRTPWWAPSCFSVVFTNAANRNRQSRVVLQKLTYPPETVICECYFHPRQEQAKNRHLL